MRLAAAREPAGDPDQLRPGKRSPYERSDTGGSVGMVADVTALIRATWLRYSALRANVQHRLLVDKCLSH